jgi:hypothetical protein
LRKAQTLAVAATMARTKVKLLLATMSVTF